MSYREFYLKTTDYENPNGLNEKALILGRKAYPKYDNVLILAGGAGSGKTFIKDKVLAFQGKNFDVDVLKTKVMKIENPKFLDDFAKDTGMYLQFLNLNKSFDTEILHNWLKKRGLNDEITKWFLYTKTTSNYKDNIIFDVTLKDLKKLQDISNICDAAGYEKVNRHLVWVLTSIEKAKEQNSKRERVVPEDILVTTHTGASMTLNQLFRNSVLGQKYIDGDVWVVFNKVGEDIKFNNATKVLDKYTALQLKKQGKPFKSIQEIEDELNSPYNKDGDLFKKIEDYTGDVSWSKDNF